MALFATDLMLGKEQKQQLQHEQQTKLQSGLAKGGNKITERERKRITWCFLPSQPLRLYQGGEREREREREGTDRQTDRQKDRQTDRHRDRDRESSYTLFEKHSLASLKQMKETVPPLETFTAPVSPPRNKRYQYWRIKLPCVHARAMTGNLLCKLTYNTAQSPRILLSMLLPVCYENPFSGQLKEKKKLREIAR